jgi:AcrR family transcriptional regulator
MRGVKGGSRRDKARATRRRIIDAAREEFAERGFHGATVASIATRARVAPQTIYFVFHTKPELISAVIDDSVLGEEPPQTPEETSWWAAMEAEPRADEALRIFIRGSAPLFARASAISEVLRAAALTDDEVRSTHEAHEGLRSTAFREVVAGLAEKGRLRQSLTVDTATDVLLSTYGDSTYQFLTASRGWSHEQLVDWLCDALPQLLLEPPTS